MIKGGTDDDSRTKMSITIKTQQYFWTHILFAQS
jgi:hypothetical protein